MRDPGESSEARRAACVACLEPIRDGARVCPHCGSAQSRGRWQALGTTLKWVGGITATISLVLGVVQVRELLESWRDRRRTVDELVRAADLQMASGDLAGAWRLIGEALELEPGAPRARERGAEVAMAWLRGLRVRRSEGETFTEVVEALTPMLARRAATGDGQSAADAIAHIGYANYLRYREGVVGPDIEASFERALELDPDNVYAHAMWGHWLLWGGYDGKHRDDAIAAARDHFAQALASGRDREYVRDLSLSAALNGSRTHGEALRIASDMRAEGETLDPSQCSKVWAVYRRVGYGPYQSEPAVAQLTAALPAQELLDTFRWLEGCIEDSGPRDADLGAFIVARLTEETGDLRRARELYTELRDGTSYWLPDALDGAFERLDAKLQAR